MRLESLTFITIFERLSSSTFTWAVFSVLFENRRQVSRIAILGSQRAREYVFKQEIDIYSPQSSSSRIRSKYSLLYSYI